MQTFQISGIDPAAFADLFELDDCELARLNVVRCVADTSFGFPCRVTLEDAAVGDELLLLNYLHQDAESPYRSSGPIFVRRGAERRVLPPNEVPPYVSRRLISLRAYDAAGTMLNAEVVQGTDVADAIGRMLGDSAVAYIHLHNALRGCFSCRADRVVTDQAGRRLSIPAWLER